MKGPHLSAFVVASLMVAIAHCFPEARDQRDVRGGNPFPLSHPAIRLPDLAIFDEEEDDSLEGWNPFGTSFNFWRGSALKNFFDDMQSFSDRIQEKMAAAMSGLMEPGSFGLGGNIPKGGNTTSTTKVIDGHVVTVNETTYQSSNNNSNVVYRVHVVDVRPVNRTNANGDSNETEIDIGGSEEIETLATQGTDYQQGARTTAGASDAEKTTETPRSVETVEDSAGNEIPTKNQIDNFNA